MAVEQFQKYLSLEKQYSAHTVKAYVRDLYQFEEFCREGHADAPLASMPYSVIRSWIISLMAPISIF